MLNSRPTDWGRSWRRRWVWGVWPSSQQ